MKGLYTNFHNSSLIPARSPPAHYGNPSTFSISGEEYSFRCARETADGTIGPWSEDLVTRFPPAWKSGAKKVKVGSIGWNDRRHDPLPEGAGRDFGSTSTRLAPAPAPAPAAPSRWYLSSPPSQQQQQQHQQRRRRQEKRFDLLVPALIETFAKFVDDGYNRIVDNAARCGDPSNPQTNLEPPTGRTGAADVEHASAADKNLRNQHEIYRHHRQSVSAESVPLANQNRASGHLHRAPAEEGGSAATLRAPARPVALNDETQDAAFMPGSLGEAAHAQGERRVVWEEHWDGGRQAPFYRLSGHDLSLWQIPAL